jgi:hypothetical protein
MVILNNFTKILNLEYVLENVQNAVKVQSNWFEGLSHIKFYQQSFNVSGIRFIVNGTCLVLGVFFISSILIFIAVEKLDYSKMVNVINQSVFLSIR